MKAGQIKGGNRKDASRKHGLMLIGCGNMAGVHCKQISKIEKLRLVCAADVNMERAEQFQREFGFQHATSAYQPELEQSDIDVVLVTTTWQPRFNIIRDCFQAGKHVLAEKPLTLYLDEMDELFALAVRKGMQLRVGYMSRFHPFTQKIAELLQAGAIGKPLAFSSIHHQRSVASSWRQDWNMLKNLLRGGVTPNVDCGIHKCDLTRLWSGSEPESVSSFSIRLDADSPADNFTHSVFRLKNGAGFILENCYSNNTVPCIESVIYGEKGKIVHEHGRYGARPNWHTEEDCIMVWHGDAYRTESFHIPPLAGKPLDIQMTTFLREIEEQGDMRGHYDDIRKSTEMVVATVLSEHRRAPVGFPLNAADIAESRQIIRKEG